MARSTKPPKSGAANTQKPRSKWRRRLLYGLGGVVIAVPAMWLAIHHIPGFGPAMADGARAVFGAGAVAWAEDVSYDVQDRINRLRYKDDKPTTFWDTPSGAPAAPPAAVASSSPSAAASADPAAPAAPKDFPPPKFEAPYANVATDIDGAWVPVDDHLGGPTAMFKAVVHPDPKRGFAAVAVLAVDLRRASLHLVPGTQEPANDKIPAARRPGLVPRDALSELMGAFNGGFKAVHGHWGMMLDGDTYVQPRDMACTVGLYKDGHLKIGTWREIKDDEAEMFGYRQTPPCLVEGAKTNAALEVEYNRNWGATVSGETVIRRSAIGLDKSGHTLFYGLGEAVTAQALARAMKAIGADSAAQLDVNYSYPRFLFYTREKPDAVPRATSSLIPKVDFVKDEYVGRPEPRDFFYLTRKPDPS